MGSNNSKHRHDVTVSGTESSVDPPNTNESKTYYIGCHINVYQNEDGKPDVGKIATQLKAALTKRNKIIFGRKVIAVPLDVIREQRPRAEKFGNVGSLYHRAEQEDKTFYKVEEIFPGAQRNAVEKAESQDFTEEAREHFVQTHGNVVGLVGIAGIGKTTLAKQLLKYVTETLEGDDAFVFHLNLKDFDYTKKINVFQFLFHSAKSDWQYANEMDKELLKLINAASFVYVTMDGLDEARIQNLPSDAEVIGLYDEATPDVILKNLLRGNLLPRSRKLVISRPASYHLLHPDFRPLFTLVVVGLSHDSLELLFRQICSSEEEHKRVMKSLRGNSSIKSFCYLPAFAKTIVPYIKQLPATSNGSEICSLCDVFAVFLGNCVRSPKFNQDLQVVESLCDLALKGMLHHKFIFTLHDLKRCGITARGLEDFIGMQVRACDPHLRILDGDKVYFFSHLLWQEFFSAMKLMLFAPLQEFEDLLPILKDHDWEMVLRFLFGFLNPDLQDKLVLFSSDQETTVGTKRQHLMSLCREKAENFAENSFHDFPVPLADLVYFYSARIKWDVFQHRPDDATLFTLCGLAYESNDAEVVQTIADSLPDMLLISKNVLPSQAESLLFVLKARERPIALNIGVYNEPANFVDKGLVKFLNGVNQTNQTIRKLHVSNCDFDVGVIDSSLRNHMEELSVQSCHVTKETMKRISENLQQRHQPMSFFDLTLNTLETGCIPLLGNSLDFINRLELVRCSNMTQQCYQVLSENIAKRPSSILEVNLSHNQLDTASLKWISLCVHKIVNLRLFGCDITSTNLVLLTDALSKMKKEMNLLTLSGNPIGVLGLLHLSKCIYNVPTLALERCGIESGREFDRFTDAIKARSTPMHSLNLSLNKLTQVEMQSLSKMLHNINFLWLDSVGICGSDLQSFAEPLMHLNKPIGLVALNYNDIGSRGLEILTPCVDKIDGLMMDQCNIQFGQEFKQFCLQVYNLTRRMKHLELNGNQINAEGIDMLKKCEDKVENLSYNKDLNVKGKKNLVFLPAIRRPNDSNVETLNDEEN